MSRSRTVRMDIGKRFLHVVIALPSVVIAMHLMLVFVGPHFR